ncbi:hypothetical protein A2U01_0090155, partial [Trifolium medium]|nr:hypothetical protein [Trifolium medium]
MVGDISRFTSASIEELQKKALGHGLKGLLLSYLLSSRQEQEVSEGRTKWKWLIRIWLPWRRHMPPPKRNSTKR